MKKLQVAVAVASLFAAGVVSAATISQSGVTIAREVIANNTQVVIAPTATFTYAGSLSSNAKSSQDFNIVLNLKGDGTPLWSTAAASLPTVGSVEFKMFDGGTYKSLPVKTGAPAAGTAAIVFVGVEVVNNGDGGLSVGANTALRYKFRLVNDTAVPANLSQVQVNFNVNKTAVAAFTDAGGVDWDTAAATVPADVLASVTNLYTTNGPIDTTTPGTSPAADICSDGAKKVTLTAYNYTGSGIGAVGESTLTGVTNNGYILLDQALGAKITKANWTQSRTLDPATSYRTFVYDGASNLGSNVVMNLGSFNVDTLNAAAWDVDVFGQYYNLRPVTGNPVGFNDLAASSASLVPTGGANASTQGKVDVTGVTLTLTSSNGFAENSTIFLSNSPSCVAAGSNIVSAAGTVPAADLGTNTWRVTFNNAALTALALDGSLSRSKDASSVGALWTAPALGANKNFYVCYGIPGNKDVPQSTFNGFVTVSKARLAGGVVIEQDNVSCKHDLNGLGGGVKIDVRNFMPYDPSNTLYMGIIRVINNSENTDADLWAQYIRADGKYGKFGSLGTLKARGARYFTSKEIDTLLTTNTATGDAPVDNTGAGGLTAAAGEALPANTRLRVSSTKASTLRVQNYIYHTVSGALTEVSGAQGADFVNIETFNQNSGVDSQDAQTGIKK